MDNIDADGYRANVGIVLSNDAGAVLLGGGEKGKAGGSFPRAVFKSMNLSKMPCIVSSRKRLG